jgi:hypothetical protein
MMIRTAAILLAVVLAAVVAFLALRGAPVEHAGNANSDASEYRIGRQQFVLDASADIPEKEAETAPTRGGAATSAKPVPQWPAPEPGRSIQQTVAGNTQHILDNYEALLEEMTSEMRLDPLLQEEADLQHLLLANFLEAKRSDALVHQVLCGTSICLIELHADGSGVPMFSMEDIAELRIPPAGLMFSSLVYPDGLGVMYMVLVRGGALPKRSTR